MAPATVHAEDTTPKRPPQNYGVPHETTAEEVLLWPPRVVLFPLWLVSEFLVRRPLGALVKAAERNEWPQHVIDILTFGERRQFTIFPSAFFDFGLLPSVGFNAKWKYFGADPNTVKLHFGTWGTDWIALRLTDTYALSKKDDISVDARFVRRQDNPFYGLGPTSGTTRARYATEVLEGALGYDRRFWRSSALTTRSGVRGTTLRNGTCCSEPSISDRIDAGAYPAPPGYGNQYVGAFESVSLALDSRKPRPEHGSGVRLEMQGEGVFVPAREMPRAWARYGALAAGFLDLTGTQRVVSLGASVEFADAFQGDIPFVDQVTLGGDDKMRGFLRNRMIDRSSFVVGLHYTWPIWVSLDGVIETDVGNVFGAHLENFDPKLFRLSTGLGIRSNGERQSGFEFLVAGGTDPFAEGFSVTSLRLLVGSHHGF